MQVFAYYTSPLTGTERKYQLVSDYNGFVFMATDNGTLERGTWTDDENKFTCLDLFRHIYKEMSPRFELI